MQSKATEESSEKYLAEPNEEALCAESLWKQQDLTLARRLATGDPNAMRELVGQHGAHLKRVIGSLLTWNGDVDDMVQETLLRIWRQSASYRAEAPFQHWATRIAVRVCRNHQRSFGRYVRLLTQAWTDKRQQLVSGVSSQHDERWERMQTAMTRLSYRERELIVLYHLEEVPLELLAQEWGVRVETLHVRLHRVRAKLTEMLAENNE